VGALCAALLVTACPQGAGNGTPPGKKNPPAADASVAQAPIRRLTQAELNRTVRDLFPGVDVPFVALNDGEGKGFEGDVERQTPSDLVVEQLRTGAIDVAAAAASRLDLVLPRQPSADVEDQRAVGHELIAAFGPRALRRPLEEREALAYGALFDQMLDQHNFRVAVQLVLQAFLQSPSFVYRVEIGTGDPDDEGAIAIAPYEMASRLSYLLWGTMPDQALFDAAAANELQTPEQLEAQARRMLDDEKAHDAILSFHRQWLDLDKVLTTNKDAATYPTWNDQLRRSIRTEADKMIEEVVFSGDATLRSLLTTTTTRVDAPLAALYGIPAPASDWDLVELPGEQRAGLVTQAAFLASRGHAVNPSPVLRGVWVLERLLCEAPPPPMAGISTDPPDAEDEPAPTTNRQRYSQHTFDPVCQGCHAGIDGIGFGLESYDSIGAFRTTDSGLPVDNSGSLEATSLGGTFAGGPELAALLGDSDIVRACAVRHWLDYAHGRKQERADTAQFDDVDAAFESAGGDIKELLVALVTSEAFRTRPALEVTP
jgi:hypothetical protein